MGKNKNVLVAVDGIHLTILRPGGLGGCWMHWNDIVIVVQGFFLQPSEEFAFSLICSNGFYGRLIGKTRYSLHKWVIHTSLLVPNSNLLSPRRLNLLV